MKRYILFFCLFSILLASCANDDHLHVIPKDSVALIAIDGQQLNSTNGGVEVLQEILQVDGLEKSGIDFTSKIYLFETVDGTFGLCAKVDDQKDLSRFIEEKFYPGGRCSKLTERRGYPFTVLDNSWVVGFSSSALLVMGPTGSMEQTQLQQRMSKYLDADEDNSVTAADVYQRMEEMDAPVSMVMQLDALPEAIATPLMIGAPKKADASQVWLSATIVNSDKCLEIAGHTFSLNPKIDEALKASFNTFRPITDKFITKMWQHALFGLFLNTKGDSLLPILQANKGIQVLLTGMNTAIDMDNILRSADGDIAVIVSKYEQEKPVIGLLAQLAHTDWLKDIGYWKQSCPAGTAIRDNSPQEFVLDLDVSHKGKNIFPFGVSDNKIFYGGQFQQDSELVGGIPSVEKRLPDAVLSKIKGKKLGLVLTMDALKQQVGTSIANNITTMLTPLFGEVTTIIYTIK